MADQKKLRPRQVAAYQSLRPVMVDESATCGAQIGVNLLLPDGTVGTIVQLAALFGSSTSSDNGTLTTTDDLEEGQWNLWFTNRRAQDAVGGILANSANVTLAYAGSTITANLTPITFGGSGSLYAFTFDTYGRVVDYRTPSTDDLAEGTNLYFTAARVRAAVLTGLSSVTSAVIAATDTVLGALGKLQAQITDNLLPPGYIDGLKMVWVSGTALTVTTGAAYIVGGAKVLRATADIAKTGLSLSASTWYHVYLYDNAGTPDVEIVTTAPAAPYNGTARAKTGDTSRRYVGSVKADASGGIYKFNHVLPSTISYLVDTNSGPFFLLSAGTATVTTTISAAGVCPATARSLWLTVLNAGTSFAYVRLSNSAGPSAATGYLTFASPGGVTVTNLALDGAQSYTYAYDAAPAGNVTYHRTFGYTYER